MAKVHKLRNPKPPPGYVSGKRGNQNPLEERVRQRAADAIRRGKKFIECYNDLWLLIDGKPVHWSLVDPERLGR